MTDPLILLYRADWTLWSFSAEAVTRQDNQVANSLAKRVKAEFLRQTSGILPIGPLKASDSESPARRDQILIAPGGRYRYQPSVDISGQADLDDLENEELVTLVLSDGEFCWVIRFAQADRYPVDPARTPIDRIVRPGWILSQLRLAVTGTTELSGRPMLMVAGTPRPRANRWATPISLLDRVNLVVDAELGVVVRRETIYQGQPLSTFELRDFTVDPAAGAAVSFRPDDGIEVEVNDYGPGRSTSLWNDSVGAADDHKVASPGGIAISAAKGALFLAARNVSRPEPASPGPPDREPQMPVPDPGELATPITGPVSDRTLALLARADRLPVSLSAQVHQWIDSRRALAAGSDLCTGSEEVDLPAAIQFFGGEQQPALRRRHPHRIASLRVAMPDRFRVDYLLDERTRWPRTIACDGGRTRKVYHNRVVASPAQPLAPDFIQLIEPSWLLADWRLTEGGEETFAGRTSIRVLAVPPAQQDWPWRRDPKPIRIVVLIDAELGIVLRQVSYAADEPVAWIELRELANQPEVDPAGFGSAIAPDLPVISTSGEPVDDLDLPPVAQSIRAVGSELANGAQTAHRWLSRQFRG